MVKVGFRERKNTVIFDKAENFRIANLVVEILNCGLRWNKNICKVVVLFSLMNLWSILVTIYNKNDKEIYIPSKLIKP